MRETLKGTCFFKPRTDLSRFGNVKVTARDRAHKWLYDRCGPIVRRLDAGDYQFMPAGPTTSIRQEPYQGSIMRYFNLKGVIGKRHLLPKIPNF